MDQFNTYRFGKTAWQDFPPHPQFADPETSYPGDSVSFPRTQTRDPHLDL